VQQNGATTILLALREGLMLEGVKRALEADLSFEIVGEAHDPSEVAASTARLRPGVVLLDAHISGLNDLESLTLLRAQHPSIDVVMLFPCSQERLIQQSFERGARGFVIASINPADLGAAIRQAIEYTRPQSPPSPSPAGDLPETVLTPRETAVIEAVARGLSNKAIAAELSVTIATVKFHLTSAYRKLGVTNRTEAARWMLRKSLGD